MSSPAQEAVAWLNENVAFSDVAASHGRPDCVSMQDHASAALHLAADQADAQFIRQAEKALAALGIKQSSGGPHVPHPIIEPGYDDIDGIRLYPEAVNYLISCGVHTLNTHAKPLQLPSSRINDPSVAQRLVAIGKGKNT